MPRPPDHTGPRFLRILRATGGQSSSDDEVTAGPRVAVLADMRSAAMVVLASLVALSGMGCGSTTSSSDGGGGKGSGTGGAPGGHGGGTAGSSGGGGQTSSGTGGGVGGHGGAVGAGGAAGAAAACSVCGQPNSVNSCPADVATAQMCASQGATCCAGDQHWLCGNCAAETCHWILSCPSAGAGGSGGIDGGAGCSPACGAGSVCVGSGTVGGAIIDADDAGVCPSGTHATGFENRCEQDLSYSCSPIPSSCGGTVTCSCASTLCAAGHTCQDPSGGVLTCVEAVP